MRRSDGISRAAKKVVHATFFQKVILCALAGFAAACLIQWGKVFVEGADKHWNEEYEPGEYAVNLLSLYAPAQEGNA